MKNIALAVTLALGLTACAQELAVLAVSFDLTSFMTPESVRYDSVSDLYLVANINGAPLDKDNNGYISQISPDGKTVNARFIAGGANGVTLNRLNGLAVLSSGKVQVVPFSSNEIYTVTDMGVVGDRKILPGGQLDGVEVYNGGLLVSSWETSSFYFVSASGTVTTVASGVKSPADIGLDSKRGRVLIPLFMDNIVQVVSAKQYGS